MFKHTLALVALFVSTFAINANAVSTTWQYRGGLATNGLEMVPPPSSSNVDGLPLVLESDLTGAFFVPLIDPLGWTITNVEIQMTLLAATSAQSAVGITKQGSHDLSVQLLPFALTYTHDDTWSGTSAVEGEVIDLDAVSIYNGDGSSLYALPGTNGAATNATNGAPGQGFNDSTMGSLPLLFDLNLVASSLDPTGFAYAEHNLLTAFIDVFYTIEHVAGIEPNFVCNGIGTGYGSEPTYPGYWVANGCLGPLGGDSINLARFGGVSTVPVPAAAWLFGSALIGLAGIKRKK